MILLSNGFSSYSYICYFAQDCDMPNELTSPDSRPEAGVDHVDVMKVLGLKRADAINAKKSGGPAP